jgi:hypothetical protein
MLDRWLYFFLRLAMFFILNRLQQNPDLSQVPEQDAETGKEEPAYGLKCA